MNINSISAKNFKGLSFSHRLAPVNIVTGANFIGKTAILDAIRVGLMGYLPQLGKQPSSTYKLAGSGPEMTVNIGTLDTEISHKWKPNAKGVSYEGALPWETPTVLLDAREYLNRPAAEKLALVLRLCRPEELGYSDNKLVAALGEVEVLPTKISRPIVERMLGDVTQSMSERNGASIQDWLSSLMDSFKTNQKTAAAAAKKSGAMVSGLKPTIGTAPQDVSAELAAATTERDKLAGQIQSIESMAKQQESARAREQGLKDELLTLPDMSKAIEAAKAKIAALKHDNEAESFKIEIVNYRNRVNTITAAIGRAVGRIDAMVSPEQLECCPHCGSSQPGWNAKLAEKYYAEEKEIKAEIEKLKTERAAVEARLAGSKANFESASQKEGDIDLARHKQQAELDGMIGRQDRRGRIQSELDGIASVLSKSADTACIDALKVELSAKNEAASVLQLRQNEYALAASEKQRRTDAEAATLDQSVTAEVYKEAASRLKTMQEGIVEFAFTKLLVKARAFTDGLLKSPLVYMDGNLGMMNGEAFVSWETFSGTEELIAFAGLSVALAQSAPIKVVLMDELGRLTPENKNKLVRRMRELTKGCVIDNFVGVDVTPDPYAEIADVNIIKV